MIKYYAMAVAGLALFAAGYWIADTKADAAWAEREAQYSAAQVAANEDIRAQERIWQDKLSKVAKDAKITQERLQSDSERLAATVDGLRKSIKVSTGKHQSADTTIAELRRAGATTELVQKELLGFVITRAEELAKSYDRSRAAGLTCESTYNALH